MQLPGFTRGLAFIGRYALVGLSKVREHVFAGLPLAEHVAERMCGVWVVDTVDARVIGLAIRSRRRRSRFPMRRWPRSPNRTAPDVDRYTED